MLFFINYFWIFCSGKNIKRKDMTRCFLSIGYEQLEVVWTQFIYKIHKMLRKFSGRVKPKYVLFPPAPHPRPARVY